jgi:hypothetical protein
MEKEQTFQYIVVDQMGGWGARDPFTSVLHHPLKPICVSFPLLQHQAFLFLN